MKKTIRDIDVSGKRVLVRVDYNVPINAEQKIIDDTRIVETLPTIVYLLEHNAKVILCSHLGRPIGRDENLSLRPVMARLSKLLDKPVSFAEDVLDKTTKQLVSKMQDGDILMLENIRFYPEEEANKESFAKKLASLADIYVMEAFATAHRKHASTYGVAKLLPSVCGFLVEKELVMFDKCLNKPAKPFVAILGGAKVQDKLPVVENLLDKVDTILIGGGMAYTFVKSIGGNVGDSIVDESKVEYAKELLDKAKEKGVKIILPVDNVGAKEFDEYAEAKNFSSGFLADGYQGMDIGPKTVKTFKKVIKKAKTIIWNGPVGVYEFERFKLGTTKIAKAIAKSKATSIIGGGDSIAAIHDLGASRKVSHLSTGGGASLTLLQGKTLPCIDLIEDSI